MADGTARIIRDIDLYGRLEAVAEAVRVGWGATSLRIETIDGGANVLAVFGDEQNVTDVWDLDPLLWGEASRAAVEFYPIGQGGVIEPGRA